MRPAASESNRLVGPNVLRRRWENMHMAVVSDSHHQSTLDAVYVCVGPWSEFPVVPSYPH